MARARAGRASASPRFRLARLSPGAYLLNDRWEINRTREGALILLGRNDVAWYWRDRRSAARSGYFDTKAAAVRDLLTNGTGGEVPPAAPTRGYSRTFPFGEGRYMLDGIPADLWARVRSKAEAEGVSLRTLLLQLVSEWLAEPSKEMTR